jgi:hypothetical protein
VEGSSNDANPFAVAVEQRQGLFGMMRKSGSASSLLFGRPTQVWMPKSRAPPARSSGGVRSEWTMPRPAVIQLTAPGRIG